MWWSGYSYTADWITATPCSLACLLANAMAVCSQSGCSPCTRATWLCFSYCTDAQLITLAQLSTASDIQTIRAHVKVSARASTGVPDQTVCADFYSLGSVTAPIGRWQPTGGPTKNTNIYVRSSSVFYIWSGCLEYLVIWTMRPVYLTRLF